MAGAACISTAAPLAAASGLPPSVSAFWRMAFGGAILAVALVVSGRWRTGGWRDWAWMSVPALAFAADLWLWHRSIVAVGPGLSTLLANFQVFVMALAGFVFFRERLGPRYLAGLMLAAGGLWLLLGRDWGGLSDAYRHGVWFGLATGLAYAVYLLSFRQVQRRHSSLPTIQLLAIASLLCAPMLGMAGLVEGRSFVIPTLHALAALLALAVLAQCLGWWLIASAMPRLSASAVGLGLLLQPLLAFLQDVLLFGRPTLPIEWLGLSLALIGIFFGTRASAAAAPVAATDGPAQTHPAAAVEARPERRPRSNE